jgi:cytochrome oxidase Cu insertion factor (SCO1/SenC/PrrC family)
MACAALLVAIFGSVIPTLGKTVVSKKPVKLAAALRLAPDFTLIDADGKVRTLKEFRGRPVVLFFSCGCPWCAKCATLWGQFQRGGTFEDGELAGKHVVTVLVESGDGDSTRQFARENGMDLTQTVLLPDVQMHVTNDLYHVDPCPRFFVVDPQGRLRYTNNHKDDQPRVAPEIAIVSRTLDALRDSVRVITPNSSNKKAL